MKAGGKVMAVNAGIDVSAFAQDIRIIGMGG